MTNREVIEAIMRNTSLYEGIREVPTRKIEDSELRHLVENSQAYLEDLDQSIEELEDYIERNV